MEKFEHDGMRPERGGELTVGSAPQAKVVAIWVEDEDESDGAEMSPTEARALAALLLKHADRAEGADARRSVRAVEDEG